ncbi:aspartate dehydrogenase [Hydrogenophaga sp. BPS33]|uniref:aspartate dehydrogenase n=1 Tax=Hydrogenophaga sp. BPS33 TaxID=2651974 RepID=UPI00131F7194|nr:aspartate dehydrogenase [Hydrogenophaga sp. BPS33]QHE87390.1 aspartate dehydrogenase [Hydrogenophaga sp. BPS33]
MSLRVALIGFGAIGQRLARGLLAHPEAVELTGVLVHELDPARAAAQGDLQGVRALLTDQRDTWLATRPELVVECAGHAAVDAHAEAVLRAGCDLLLASVGSLTDDDRLARLQSLATASGRQVQLVSGAIGGIDWLTAARDAGLRDVVYRGRKPPAAWRGSPAEAVAQLSSLDAPALVFEGSARQAARDFPRNANVAATVALATLGLDHTRVELWADPGVTENRHEVEAWGEAGHLLLRLDNRPDPQNPRTSLVTAHSALRAVLNRCAAVVL